MLSIENVDPSKDDLKRGDNKHNFPFAQFYSVYDKGASLLDKYIFVDQESTKTAPMFTKAERWNIFLYIVGIMLYKFGLESYNGTVRALAIDRFTAQNYPVYTYQGYLDGFNSTAQCVGSILIGPLMRFFPLKKVLFMAMILFAVISSLVMIIEKASGGTFPTHCTSHNGLPPVCTGAKAGNWNPSGIIPIFVFAGIPYGAIELIRRIIPQQLVGGDEHKLKKLDSIVHIYYEMTGTAGAFFATYVSLMNGKAYAPVVTPPCYFFAALIWISIVPPTKVFQMIEDTGPVLKFSFCSLLTLIVSAFKEFFQVLYQGARIVILDSRFTWLIFGYSIPLVMHRYIENGVASVYAKLVLGESAYGSFIVGGSNFGELLGAATVFFNLNTFPTPIPLLRWDALVLNLTWLYYNVVRPDKTHTGPANTAGIMAAIMCFISAGWAAGDVSLAAFIQSNISNTKVIQSGNGHKVSPLAAVMSFLYVTYIVIYAIISPLIGHWLDGFALRQKHAKNDGNKALAAQLKLDAKQQYFYWIAGVMFSLVSVIIFASTFYPRGSWKFNPERLEEYDPVEVTAESTSQGKQQEMDDEEKVQSEDNDDIHGNAVVNKEGIEMQRL
eukprot:gene15649-21160_t